MHVAVIGAGPAGLSASYHLIHHDHRVTLYEQDSTFVGGISRTVLYKGYRFDIGGHRFFSKNPEIEAFWRQMLGEDLLTTRRLSRIFYQGKFYAYPLKAGNAFKNMGLINTTWCLADYLKSRVAPRRSVRSFEDWVINQFGQRLYQMFFKTYTEKVWGMACRDISADWAVQRIQGLNLFKAITSSVLSDHHQTTPTIKTLADSFRYPRLGPGMLWERLAAEIQHQGAEIHMGAQIVQILSEPSVGITAIQTVNGDHAKPDRVISSMALRSLVRILRPMAPRPVRQAAEALKYRDFITAVLIVEARSLFPDHWIYIHDPRVKVGRIQNYKNWSPDMVPDETKTCLGMEYFCFEGDGLWTMPDQELLALAEREARLTGLLGDAACVDGTVVRVPKAYPVYDEDYAHHISTIRQYLALNLPNLQSVGRNGMHRYNNQDHAMLTGTLAAKNLSGGHYDIWAVNEDAEYLETATNVRLTPRRIHSV